MDCELTVMHYLAAQGLFLSPQFSIRDGGGEWSCPDFVALDFLAKEIQVVEVTSAWEVSALIGKIQRREEQWYKKLRQQLAADGVQLNGWGCVVRAFVRHERCEYLRKKLGNPSDVRIEAIEGIAFPWRWEWDQGRVRSVPPWLSGGAPNAARP